MSATGPGQRVVVEKDRWDHWRVVGGYDIPRELAELALGRILRMGSRPTQPGDVADYERCRAIILDYAEQPESGLPVSLLADPAYHPSYARDYRKGAQGDA